MVDLTLTKPKAIENMFENAISQAESMIDMISNIKFNNGVSRYISTSYSRVISAELTCDDGNLYLVGSYGDNFILDIYLCSKIESEGSNLIATVICEFKVKVGK